LQEAIDKAFTECDEVIIETYVPGTEITCGVYKTDEKSVVFPVSEVISKNEFFDYDAKYKGEVEEITPARISAGTDFEKVQNLTSEIYDRLQCKGIVRIDYIITAGENLNPCSKLILLRA
jgi:D-alanine-D-alanine ligase